MVQWLISVTSNIYWLVDQQYHIWVPYEPSDIYCQGVEAYCFSNSSSRPRTWFPNGSMETFHTTQRIHAAGQVRSYSRKITVWIQKRLSMGIMWYVSCICSSMHNKVKIFICWVYFYPTFLPRKTWVQISVLSEAWRLIIKREVVWISLIILQRGQKWGCNGRI